MAKKSDEKEKTGNRLCIRLLVANPNQAIG